MNDSDLHQEKDPLECQKCQECGGKGYVELFSSKQPCSNCADTVYLDKKVLINLFKEYFNK